jgi:hypothetical protein
MGKGLIGVLCTLAIGADLPQVPDVGRCSAGLERSGGSVGGALADA